MGQTDNFEEIVNIIWNIDQPERAIAKLMTQLTKLETKLGEVNTAASKVNVPGGGSGAPPAAPGYSAQVNYRSNATGRIVPREEGISGFANVSRSGAPPYTGRPANVMEEGGGGALMSQGGWTPMNSGPSYWSAMSGGRGLVPTGRSMDQLFNDLKRFNQQAAEELAYYKSMWRASMGGGSATLAAIGSSALNGDVVGGPLSAYGGVGTGPRIIEDSFRYAGSPPGLLSAPGYSGMYSGRVGPISMSPLPAVPWYTGGGGGGGAIPMGPPPAYGPSAMYPTGPYGQYRVATGMQQGFEMAAEHAWQGGRYDVFENIMQGDWNAARIARNRMQGRIGEIETDADFQTAWPGGAPGAGSGRYSNQAYLGSKLNSLRAQMNSATMEGRTPDIDRLGKEIKDTQDQYDSFGKKLTLFDNKFMRHIAWIAQGILIWGALRVAGDGIRTFIQELNNLESTQARLGFVNGSSYVATATQSALGAQYGLTPTQSGGGAITSAQLGLSSGDTNNARQLALVFGADQYDNALKELYQTEQRANAVGVDHVAVMNYIATAYKTAPGTMETYFDSLQQGILLSHDLGVSAEQAGLSILNMAEATEDSPERIATTLQSVIGNLRKGSVQDNLKDYGIKAGTPGDMLRDVSSQVTDLVKSGNLDKAKALIDEVTGGLNAPARQLQLLTDFQELNKLFTGTNTELSTMDGLLKNIGDTGVSTFDRLKSSFLALVDAQIAAQKDKQAKGEFQLPGLYQLSPLGLLVPGEAARAYGDVKNAGNSLAEYMNDQAMRKNYETETGLSSTMAGNTNGRRAAGSDQVDTQAYKAWLREQSGATLGNSRTRNGFGMSPVSAATPALGPTPPPEIDFGGFQNFEKGWNWDKFTSDVTSHEKLLADVPGYDIERKQFAFFDEATQSYKYMIADLNAIRFATDEQRKLMQQQITGTFNVPAGGEAIIAYFAAASGFVASTKSGKSTGSSSGAGTGSGSSWANGWGKGDPWGNGKDVFNGIPDDARGGFNNKPLGMSKKEIDYFGIPPEARAGKEYNSMKHIYKPGLDSDRQNQSQARQLQAVTVNNTIRVYIDGRVVAHSVQRQNYNQFSNIRNSAFTSPSSQVAI